MSPVFIWQTEPTWLSPSAQQERITHSLSACSARRGNQSEIHRPLCPCCCQRRFEGMSVLLAVPIAVIGRPNDSGIGWPANRSNSGLGSNKSTWLGPPSMNNHMTDLAVAAKWGGLGGRVAVDEIVPPARATRSRLRR